MVMGRLAALVLLAWVVSVAVFSLALLIPGDPTSTLLGDQATPQQVATLRASLGLDDPVLVRYGDWLGGALRGDLGTSMLTSYEVTQAISDRIGVTVSLVVLSLVVSVVVGLLIGVFAAVRPGGLFDRIALMTSSVGIAMPNFWLGLVLVTFLGAELELFPTSGYVDLGEDPGLWAAHLVLPVLTLAAGGAAEIARQTRASVADTLQLDFVRTLNAKGLSPISVIGKHALRTAMIPVVTVIGLQVSRLFGLSVLVEAVFGLPGIGSLMVSAVFERDIPMVQGTVLVTTLVVVVVNLLVDLSYRWLNPKTAA
ncbi:peptide/nickel transport system permease protein [Saccharothrix ecbatanensis]|jgi:peptide/nickel transport system permease protein|uniref:Peptide/nickel transport system permease protein n=1 Tax=Saccharothrix ecbatanensis TaxID=1105145 RepID=A0A7W9HNN5_9PSEU|nr:ABC transporter permease [Saccharothrix ecbatanensis]MBB5805637.1 peptide/nickel transport system permease protein [Saccharothrix ecbatanensis]